MGVEELEYKIKEMETNGNAQVTVIKEIMYGINHGRKSFVIKGVNEYEILDILTEVGVNYDYYQGTLILP